MRTTADLTWRLLCLRYLSILWYDAYSNSCDNFFSHAEARFANYVWPAVHSKDGQQYSLHPWTPNPKHDNGKPASVESLTSGIATLAIQENLLPSIELLTSVITVFRAMAIGDHLQHFSIFLSMRKWLWDVIQKNYSRSSIDTLTER